MPGDRIYLCDYERISGAFCGTRMRGRKYIHMHVQLQPPGAARGRLGVGRVQRQRQLREKVLPEVC